MRRRRCVSSCRRILVTVLFIVIIIIILRFLFRPQLLGIEKSLLAAFTFNIDLDYIVKDTFVGCGGNFTGHGHQFAVLRDSVLKPNDDKFYIPCQSKKVPNYWFHYGKEGTHLNSWMSDLATYDARETFNNLEISERPVGVVVMRYEYANLYHTMTDWYNVFIVVKLLNVSFSDVSIVWSSTHSKGHLDETWENLFGKVIKRPDLKQPILFKKIIWCEIGYESPINYHSLSILPFVDDFHSFVLKQHGIEQAKTLNCDSVSILFLWRRDYVAHPNNPTGRISRKVKNEDELLTYFSNSYPSARVSGQQLDALTFKEQLRLISQTDILISMHGAGLSHILFLPMHAGVIEMFTLSWNKIGLHHFKAMARWRSLKYDSWQNINPTNELKDGYTYIPPTSLDLKLNSIYQKLCP